jgi:hypothetical protein
VRRGVQRRLPQAWAGLPVEDLDGSGRDEQGGAPASRDPDDSLHAPRVHGHATIEETFSRYGHLMPGTRDQARELVDAYLLAAQATVNVAS